VEIAVESGQLSKGNRSGGTVLLAALAALSVAWSASATAANDDSALPCDYTVARDLQSLKVPINTLAIHAVDHEIIVAGAAVTKAPAADSIAAPVLDFSPRVASILDAVFDRRSQNTDVIDAEDTRPAGIENQAQDEPRKTAPVTLIEKETELRGFQRQMYRKDI
jgi:hypothetical protein